MGAPDVSISTAVPAGWDDYVRSHADASAYHQSEFVRVGHTAFRLKCYFLTAKTADGRICGVLPLIEQLGSDLQAQSRLGAVLQLRRRAG